MHNSYSNKALQQLLTQASACLQRGDAESAERECRKALRKFPTSAEALEFLAGLRTQQGNLTEARVLLERALRIYPKSARAQCLLGEVLGEQGSHDEALACFRRALSLEPGNAEIHFGIGNILSDLGQLNEAIASYDRAITMQTAFTEAHRNRGVLLHQLGRHDEALDSLNRAIALNPALPTAVFTRAKTQLELGRLQAALADLDRSATLEPSNPEVHNIRGIALQKLGRFEDALASFRLAILLAPDFAGAHWNEGLCRLTTGDWCKQSWQQYEWGWALGQRQPIRQFDKPLWLGEENISGKTVLLHDEQGLGDTIQFARLAKPLADLGAKVVLQVQPGLKGIMRTLAGPHQVIADGEERPSFDYHCPLLSLPLALGITLDNLPSPASYLQADSDHLAQWQNRLGNNRGPRVGIVWSGSTLNKDDRNRSIPLRELLSLTSCGVQLVSLKKDLTDGDRQMLAEHPAVMHFESELHDFSDTAALIMHMDLVISVCTALAHLSGALGKPTWIPLSYSPDWRWLRGRNDSPWYPTARLFRQTSAGDWSTVTEGIKIALDQFLASRQREAIS